jgi:serine/threonine protein kinase
VSAPSLQPGMMIAGKYRLSRMIGQGGMGSVFAAENTLTGKQVAIKCMHRQVARTPDAAQRFLREAKASARIRHPNVVDVYDVLAENDTFYLVMEFLEGEPLSTFLTRETTTLPQLVKVVLGAMRGVAAAHREGVIHRDIKPENIFLAREGYDQQIVPKVLDFGISKMQGMQEVGLTTPGLALGTIAYMSMEQLAGAADVDGRADVYAFGVILYQAITGHPPFESETYPALILRIMTEQALPVKTVRPDIPAKLCALVEAAMAKQRETRIPSLEAFIAELEPFADDITFERRTLLTSKLPPARKSPPVAVAIPAATSSRPPSLAAAPRTAAKPAVSVRTQSPPAVSSAPPRPPRRALVHPAAMALGLLLCAAALWWIMQPMAAGHRALAGAREGVAASDQPHIVLPAPVSIARAPAPVPPEPAVLAIAVAAPSGEPDLAAIPVPDALPQPEPAYASPSEPEPASTVTATQARPHAVRPRPARRATPAAKPDCNPNFIFDAQGEKHFKPECF